MDALRTARLHHTETVLISLPEAAFPGAVRTDSDRSGSGRAVSGDNISPQLPFLIITDVIYSLLWEWIPSTGRRFSGYADRYRGKRKRTERDGG